MGDDAPTDFAGISTDTELSQAWALDDGVDWPARRSWRPVVAAVAGSLVVVGVAAVLVFQHLRPPVDSAAPTSVTTTVVTPPEPTAPTIPATFDADVPDAATLEPPPPPKPTDYDAVLLSNLRSSGWVIWNDARLVEQVHAICAALRDGNHPDVVWRSFDAATDYSTEDSRFLVEEAILTYPNCP